ncbi:hypothetical protein, partial [Actinoplanes philippinensis]|uniref:hypothetical protein n=1 Tax=Actinoplanes philippinensis TaxID=35752 RepID=UPI0033D90D62
MAIAPIPLTAKAKITTEVNGPTRVALPADLFTLSPPRLCGGFTVHIDTHQEVVSGSGRRVSYPRHAEGRAGRERTARPGVGRGV